MKKALILGLSLSLALTLTACGGPNDNAADSTQDTSTPEVSQSVDTSTPKVEQNTQTTQGNPEQTPAVEETPTVEETPAPEVEAQPEVQLFTDCNETVYATTTVNVRDTYSTSGNKVGSLTKAQSVKRTGTGQGEAAGWSRIEFNGQVAYVNSDYLSTTKPQVSTGSSGNSGNSGGSTQTSKPSTSKPSTSKPGTSTGSSTGNTGKPFDKTPGIDWTTGNETLDEDDLDQSNSNNDDSNVGGWYDPSTGEFFQ